MCQYCSKIKLFHLCLPAFQVLWDTSRQILNEMITRSSAGWNLIVNSFFYDFLSFKRLYIPLKSTKLSFKRRYLNVEGIQVQFTHCKHQHTLFFFFFFKVSVPPSLTCQVMRQMFSLQLMTSQAPKKMKGVLFRQQE